MPSGPAQNKSQTPKNRASATDGTGDAFKVPVGGSVEADRKGGSRYKRR